MAHIQIKNLHKQFGDVKVIRDVNLTIDDHEFVVFVGPSGCGKSTLLRLISGLEDISSGEIHIDGERIDHLPPAQRGIAMVFQSYALYPHMNVYQNMSYSLRIAKQSKADINKKVKQAAEVLQLTDLLDRKPKALSGGQRQRVAIGRAIVRDPKLFLFDEPLSNLDAKLRVQMRIELTKLHKKLNATMIYVTHDQVEAMTMADKIVVIRDGIIEQVGAPLELYNHPANQFVAGFIGSPSMNFIPTTVVNIGQTSLELELENKTRIQIPCAEADLHAVGDKMQIGIRPENLSLDGVGGATQEGEVFAVERLGNETYIYMHDQSGAEVVLHSAGDKEVAADDHIKVSFKTQDCHLFAANGEVVK